LSIELVGMTGGGASCYFEAMISDQDRDNIAANVRFLQERIDSLAAAAGRPAGSVRLMAVTKTQDWDRVCAALAAGVPFVGENRWQEARDKFPSGWVAREPGGPGSAAGDDTGACPRAGFHFIGHLQKNKARKAAAFFDCIQSVDDMETLELISREAAAAGRTVRVLFEVNTSGEGTKQGVHGADALLRLVEAACGLPGVSPGGLMTIGPLGADERRGRAAFAELAGLHRRVAERLAPADWNELSMGMSGDYPWAIAEGATMVRIGTAIFGPRLGGRP
jgi:pyridoxal phosphate enzyme (YggS family)